MRQISRRGLITGAAGSVLLGACGGSAGVGKLVLPSDGVVARREERRQGTGNVVRATITAAPTTVSIGGREVQTWAFGERPSDGAIRVGAGDVLEARFVNSLPAANTVHWHGVALRNDMDGVHDMTQAAVEPGSEFVYRFVVPDPGTYWFHPHMGLELDRGLYAALIVDDPSEPLDYDVEFAVVLDDWLDGFGTTPEAVLRGLQSEGGHSAHDMGSMDMGQMGAMTGLNGDVSYPLHLINGRAPSERSQFDATPGQRVRLRIINAASDTAYRFAVGGHELTVTHTDGFSVEPVTVDHIVLGMGERYDVILTAGSGVVPIVAVPEGKADPAAEAVLRTTSGAAPSVGSRPPQLEGRALSYFQLAAAEKARLPERSVDRDVEVRLTADSGSYLHGIGGKSFPSSSPVEISEGERLRVRVLNETMMFHPIHLHGHTFQMASKGSARKDTVNVEAMSSVEFDIDGDNPGQWMLHCHNTYHLETGMATTLSYRR